jgi:glutamate racemase
MKTPIRSDLEPALLKKNTAFFAPCAPRKRSSEESIGIFDSGCGGLSVVRALRTVLPHEHILYFGDTARLPYGGKSPSTLLRYSLENTAFLTQKRIKLLIVACNTACSAALEEVRKASDVPVIGITEQGVEAVSRELLIGTVGILGTQATIASQIYEREILKRCPGLKLIPIPCPLLVPLIEEGYVGHPMSALVVGEYLRPLKHVSGVLLGCTHYPFLKATIEQELGPNIPLIDPAYTCAEEACRLLREAQLLNLSSASPRYQFFVSDDPSKFRRLGEGFLNCRFDEVFLA